ncbi:hypothetical protein [Actinophytocola gossypii]|uniref:DUF4386 family protein n=1 Tax=Actinophytocola gossypii TaxID=2812003 RepID=A0ABT2JED9_9PSEU|nr:hypothetical protein [Actinophytocola gossypii]MCT2585790.1 hypothetical protein [Actinophytocola gossypii]
MTANQDARRGNWGVLTGSLFVVLWFAGTIVQGMSGAGFPRPTDDMATVAGYIRDGADRMGQSAGLQILSAFALLCFAGILAAYLRRTGRGGAAAELVQGAGVASAVTLMVGTAATVALGTTDLVNDDASAQLLYQMSFWLAGPIHIAALGAMMLAAAYGLAIPAWLRISGMVIGAIGVVAAASPIVSTLVVATPIGRFAGFLWIIVLTVLLAVRRAPAAAPTVEQPAQV